VEWTPAPGGTMFAGMQRSLVGIEVENGGVLMKTT
jgi:hypothetical protein